MSFALLRSPLRLFRRLTIGKKLLTSFGILLVVLGLSFAAILFYLSKINSYVDRHHRITVPALATTAAMQQLAGELRLTFHRWEHAATAEEARESFRQGEAISHTLRRQLEVYRGTHLIRPHHPRLLTMLDDHGRLDLVEEEAHLVSTIASTLSHVESLWAERAGASPEPSSDGLPRSLEDLSEHLIRLVLLQTAVTAEMKAEGDLLSQQGTVIVVAGILLLAGLILLTYAVAHSQIAEPLRSLAATADRVAHHDLAARFQPLSSQDEVGRLSKALAAMLANLRERSSALERKTKELEAFTYSVAHDLKGPLREIEGFSSLLEKQFAQTQDEQLRHRIDVIRTSALRLTHMIDALLKYSRLEQASLPMSRFNLLEMLGTLAAERLSGAQGPKPRITIDLPFADLYGEPVSIRQALANLLDNAVKFARPGEPADIVVTGTLSATETILCIRDRGIGFDQAYADRIFGLFERLHGAQAFEGTGVGLAIVKLVMDKHGGRVWAESMPGQGATFYLAFPQAIS
ncbi:Histidine kinase [Nitrospira tepida]|uniref:histidine kinase n=1 Tax=Nitrospira tepida TaxID=2973512 RepID=A0AA86MYU0_9BACT|nr:ATP-binding protein [Nitrospira tepida]CAI4031554.1 Histidine kinase [Nitrospira tepida]